MQIKFKCPCCGNPFSVHEKDAGKKGKCPCGAIIQIPLMRDSSAVLVMPDKLSQSEQATTTKKESQIVDSIQMPDEKKADPVITHKNVNLLQCPKCSSTQVTGNTKGFSGLKALGGALIAGPIGLLAGLHGSKEPMVSCLNCGYSWLPQQRRQLTRYWGRKKKKKEKKKGVIL